MDKDVNFGLFTDILMTKLDLQRAKMDQKAFCSIDFPCFGLPDVIVRLFSFLAQEPPHLMGLKKGR